MGKLGGCVEDSELEHELSTRLTTSQEIIISMFYINKIFIRFFVQSGGGSSLHCSEARAGLAPAQFFSKGKFLVSLSYSARMEL